MLILTSERNKYLKSVGILYTRDVTHALAETKDLINLFSNRNTQSDQNVSLHVMITIQKPGAQRTFDHPVEGCEKLNILML